MSDSFFNMHVGYGQGMNDICALLMNVASDEVSLFWLFKRVMEMLLPLYDSSAEVINRALAKVRTILRFCAPALAQYFDEQQVNFTFTYKCVALLFKRFFSAEDCTRLWDARAPR